jgi:hypothetical protein
LFVACDTDAQAPAPPPQDPATLPKVKADVETIRKMLTDRFGDDVARNIKIEVDDSAGVRVRLTGEVPTEQIRQAIMKEVEVRVEGLRIQDFNLEIAGPIRMLSTFDAALDTGNWVVFSPDLRLAASAQGAIYETATGRKLNQLALGGVFQIQSAAFSPDSKTLATGHTRGAIVLWDMPAATNHKVLVPPLKDIRTFIPTIQAIEFSADGKSLATLNGHKGELMVWDLASVQGKLIGAHQRDDAPSVLSGPAIMAFAPGGSLIASAYRNDDGIILWDVASRARKDTLSGKDFYPDAVAYSKDGKYLAVARFAPTKPGTILVFDVASKQSRPFEADNHARISSLAISDDNKTLAARYDGSVVRIWDMTSGAKWLDIPFEKVGGGKGLRFSPDGAVLATECSSLRPPGVRLWDVSKRPGGSGVAKLPAVFDKVEARDDELAAGIETAIRKTFDRRNIESLKVEVLPDGSVRLTGKVSSQPVKDNAGRQAAVYRSGGLSGPTQRKVINELEVTGRYGPPR